MSNTLYAYWVRVLTSLTIQVYRKSRLRTRKFKYFFKHVDKLMWAVSYTCFQLTRLSIDVNGSVNNYIVIISLANSVTVASVTS